MTISSGTVIRCSLEGTLPLGQQFANILHVRVGGTVSGTDDEILSGLCDSIDTHLVPGYLDWLSSACTLDRIIARTITNPPEGHEKAKNVAGNAGGTPHAHQLACLIVWKTGFLGRRYQGRTFLPPTQQSALANSSWVSGALSTAGAFAESYLDFFADTGDVWEPIVWSQTHNSAALITGYRTIRDARTMSRRTPGFGS